jgi:hypothetical protein
MQSKDENGTPEPLAQTDHRHDTCEKYSLSLLKHRFGIMPRVALSEAWTTRRKLRAGGQGGL